MELSKDVGTDKATSSVILYAMMHVCSHFFFWLTSIALIAWFLPLQLPLSLAMSIIVAVCLVLIYFFFRGYKKGLVVTITRILGKLPIVGKKIALMSPATKERLNIIDGQIKNLKGQRVKTFYMALSLEYLARLINCCEIMLIIYALGHHASYIDALIILALSSLFANIMFFSPMQLGTREGGLFLAFKTVGLVPSLSVSVSLITRIRELFWIMIGILIMKIKVKK